MALGHSPAIVSEGLIFSMDPANTRSYGGSGVTVYPLVSGMAGTLINGPTFSTANNGCFVFDGTNDILTFGGQDILGSTYTHCAWFKMNVLQTCLVIDGGWAGTVIFSNRVEYYYSDTAPNYMNANYNFSAGRWYFICAVRGAAQKQVYIDGALINSANSTDSYSCPYTFLNLGSNSGSQNLNGNIGVVHVYNRALSATEIKQNFEATRDRYGI